mgnify:CR=1 FL=1
MKYYLNDDETLNFSSKDDFQSYLNYRKETDEWKLHFINTLACYGVNKLPLFTSSDCKDIKVDMGTYHIDVKDINPAGKEEQECIDAELPFLCIPEEKGYKAVPTRGIAFNTILQRAEMQCGLMTRFEPKTNKQVHPAKEKYEWLTKAFSYYGDISKILIRDGKVSAVLSKEYQILPVKDLIDVLEEELSSIHENLSFESASVSHEYTVVKYLLNDRVVEETLRLKLNDYGCNITSLRAGVQFSSSDVGLSSVRTNVFIICDGIHMVLGGVSMPHKGDASIEKFHDCFDNFGLILQEMEDKVEKLGNMDIMNVRETVRIIAEKYPQIFPVKARDEVLTDLSTGAGTGMDIFIALNDIVDRHIKQNEVSPTRYLQITEQVYSFINIPFDKVESGEATLKKKNF